ncbi:hypothetical protein TanjilG_12439 [Lupinus angustifolius]|uniref:K Homology domain-containing protein n=1 Tax=Lupinus angustifolius TaxID=3871 RepID=A0A4P1QYG6_LUPAN|nr:hypothetical protein TanjilG_12439 [Lupinus angustifolius]
MKIDVPNGRVGVIIATGAKIQVTRDTEADLNSSTRMVEITGTPDAIAAAERLINEVLAEAESGGSGIVGRRLYGQAGSDEFSMKIPNNKVGLIIGKGGETIKGMQASTGACIQGYAQDSYGAYNAPPQSGYGQPPEHDQQQGYSSAPSYGSGSNQAQDGHTSNCSSQGDSAQAAPSQPITKPKHCQLSTSRNCSARLWGTPNLPSSLWHLTSISKLW